MKWTAALCAICAVLAAGVASAATGPPSGTVTGRLLVNPMSVALVLPSGPVAAGKNFKVRATVANAGAAALQNVAVTLVAPSSLALRDPATQHVAVIAPAGGASMKWDACATVSGGYILLARAIAGPFVSDSTGQLVQVAQAKKPTC